MILHLIIQITRNKEDMLHELPSISERELRDRIELTLKWDLTAAGAERSQSGWRPPSLIERSGDQRRPLARGDGTLSMIPG